MSVYVFVGPTISVRDAAQELDAVYLPPAVEGDVYRVTLCRPNAIGIIDGYFQTTPTVRHKEILWAMSRGILVFGSASIGALRAAELTAFGMEGVGTVFEFYRDGILEDDDEVAVVHGPAECGFVSGSEAMVNIRQTLQKAELSGVISSELRVDLENTAKELFYPDRSYSLMLKCASERGLARSDLARLEQWLPQNRVNQKRDDAIAMLRRMRSRLEEGLEAKTVSFCFQNTAMWEASWRRSGELRHASDGTGGTVALESLMDELRFKGDKYEQYSLMALERFFALREAERLGTKVSDDRLREQEDAFRRERGLIDEFQFDQWLLENNLSNHEFKGLMADEARVRWVRQRARLLSDSSLSEQVRLSGEYPRLIARAKAKHRLLDSLGFKNPSLENAGLTQDQLMSWYFQEILGRTVPDDPQCHADRLGFANVDAFRRALLKEYLYRSYQTDEPQCLESDGP